jgi:hypothetical protein
MTIPLKIVGTARRRIAGAVTSVLLASLAIVGQTEHATAITNANRTALAPWSVGLVITKIGPGGKSQLCTGTALTRHWIVTSAHCLSGKSVRTHTIKVFPESARAEASWVYSGKASYYNHPAHGSSRFGGDKADDLGLVRLYGDGMVPDITAKVENGPNVADPSRWKDGAWIFFVAGFGSGTDVGKGQDCDDRNATDGSKRIGRFRLSGNTDDNGILGLGNPIAVEGETLDNELCPGDSGSPWAFATGGSPYKEMRVFGVHSGSGLRSNPLLGTDDWATLLPPRMRWITDTSAAKGLPINCPSFGERGKENSYRRCTDGYWMMSRGATAEWRRFQSVSTPLSSVRFGDFDGDGHSGDAFVSSRNGKRYVLYTDATEWTMVMDLNQGFDPLAFGDFDGDGATDVLIQNGGAWKVSFATRDRTKWSAFLSVKTSDVSPARLDVGDFDGDGAADVIRSREGVLQVSFATKDRTLWSDWKPLVNAGVSLGQLRFRDFDGDGVTDVFRKRDRNNTWDVSYATKDRTHWTNWKAVGSSEEPLVDLGFGDFDGNGTTDILRSNGGLWMVSSATKDRTRWSKWVEINRSRIAVPQLSFSDLDGDGRTDVVYLAPVKPVQ